MPRFTLYGFETTVKSLLPLAMSVEEDQRIAHYDLDSKVVAIALSEIVKERLLTKFTRPLINAMKLDPKTSRHRNRGQPVWTLDVELPRGWAKNADVELGSLLERFPSSVRDKVVATLVLSHRSHLAIEEFFSSVGEPSLWGYRSPVPFPPPPEDQDPPEPSPPDPQPPSEPTGG